MPLTPSLLYRNPVHDAEAVYHKTYDVLPAKHKESEALSALKEKYQRFKDN
jgi:hypothetical protein